MEVVNEIGRGGRFCVKADAGLVGWRQRHWRTRVVGLVHLDYNRSKLSGLLILTARLKREYYTFNRADQPMAGVRTNRLDPT